MRTVTIGVTSSEEARRRARAAFRGKKQGEFISFASAELLWRVLTPKRWALLQAMVQQGPLAIREIARRTGRDVRAVHSDVHALLQAGVIDRSEDGRMLFGYDAIHVDFVLRAAA
jgi:predicted transcriptional regulator